MRHFAPCRSPARGFRCRKAGKAAALFRKSACTFREKRQRFPLPPHPPAAASARAGTRGRRSEDSPPGHKKTVAKPLFCKKEAVLFGSMEENPYLCTAIQKNSVALLAQLVEQLTLNQWVQGSSP